MATTAEKTTLADILPAPPALGISPLPDPPPMEDMSQEPHNTAARSILRTRYAADRAVLVLGECYLIASRSGFRNRLVPDCLVALGVNAAAALDANGYVIDEMGKPPDFVLEVASESTARRDYREKPALYEAMGVSEYWRFDRTGGAYYDRALAGDILSADDRYVPIETREDADGRIWGYSPALELRLYWDDGVLRFYDLLEDEFLRDHLEEREGRLAERERRLAAESENARLSERNAYLEGRNARLEERDSRLRRLLNWLMGRQRGE